MGTQEKNNVLRFTLPNKGNVAPQDQKERPAIDSVGYFIQAFLRITEEYIEVPGNLSDRALNLLKKIKKLSFKERLKFRFYLSDIINSPVADFNKMNSRVDFKSIHLIFCIPSVEFIFNHDKIYRRVKSFTLSEIVALFNAVLNESDIDEVTKLINRLGGRLHLMIKDIK